MILVILLPVMIVVMLTIMPVSMLLVLAGVALMLLVRALGAAGRDDEHPVGRSVASGSERGAGNGYDFARLGGVAAGGIDGGLQGIQQRVPSGEG